MLYRVGVPLNVALGKRPVAVAGTRDPTPWGRRLAREVGRRLAETGYAVVTGLARGVDEEATVGALETGGRVVAVLPYLLEEVGVLNPRVAWLLRVAASRGASASAVSENLVKDSRRIKTWLATRNRIVVRLSVALIIPEARFKPTRWGTLYAVEYALAAGRPVVVFKSRAKDGDVVKGFEYFRQRGALVVDNIDEMINIIEHLTKRQTRR